MNETATKYPLGLWVIGAFKLVSGLLLVAVGVGLFRHANSNPTEAADQIVAALRLDPDNHYIHSAIARVSGINPRQLRAISVGTFLYASMYLIEGTGLLLRKRWGEYFTVFATGFFIPLEIFEVFRKLTAVRLGIMTINVVIVAYLIDQLLKKRRAESGSHSSEPASASTPPTIT